MDTIVKDGWKARDHWVIFEWQGRGSIHAHGVGHTVDSLAARAAWVAITAPTAMSPCPSV